MKIAIEALGIHFYGGGRSATVNLLQALFSLDQENEYVLFLTRPEPDLERPNVRQHIVPIRNRFAARLWAQINLPRLVRGCDLTHSIKNLGVFGLPTPSVVTVYDMTTLLFPELFPRLDIWYWKTVERWTLRRAARVIAISQQTAADIQRFYDLPDEQIEVIYPSCGRHFEPASPADLERIRAAYGLSGPYVLHVGRIDPKKNISLLIEAYARFRERSDYPGELVLVGELYQKKPDRTVYATIERLGLQENVRLVGGVPDLDMPVFYWGSVFTVFPSVHEGFGIVALEAMSSGAPLIVNQAGAVTEVVGQAAVIMPESTAECLAELMADLWSNPTERRRLRDAGLIQARRFSWEDSARKTLQLYRQVVKAG